jgi:quinoprotein glucose dehydrogenase
MKRLTWIKLGLVASLLVGGAILGLYYLISHNTEAFKSILARSSTGSLLIDAYRKIGPSRMEINDVPYSIFSEKPAWEIDDEKARRDLPEFTVIPGLNLDDFTSASSKPSLQFKSWERSGADAYSSKYSALDQINKANVRNLQLAWSYNSGETILNKSIWRTNVETNPIIADGKIFVTTPADFLVSLNAVTGTENWRLKLYGPARRGLLWWAGNKASSPRLYVPAGDGVYAVDPATGKLINSFGEQGRVGDASLVAPAVDGDRLIIATVAPSVEAYDVVSGKLLWKTPLLQKSGSPAPADGQAFKLEGGAPWGGFSLDSARSRVYVSTGEGRPGLYGVSRPGKNDFANSIVSIDTNTGEIKWSFQEVSHDLWDFDLPAPPILLTIKKDGKLIDVVATVTKIGNTLILDRDNGNPIFDFRLRKAPVSKVPGERTWPYQPAVETPEPFMRQVFERSDITNIGESDRIAVQKKLKNAQFGFFVPPTVGGTVALFGLHGGAGWSGAAVDEATGTLFVPSNRDPWVLRLYYKDKLPNTIRSTDSAGDALYQNNCSNCHGKNREGYYEHEFTGDKYYPSLVGITASGDFTNNIELFREDHSDVTALNGVSVDELKLINRYLNAADHISDDRKSLQLAAIWQLVLDGNGYPGSQPPWGAITAIDLSTGKSKWEVPFGEYPELTKKGIPITGQTNFGGLIATKGQLIFATGTVDKKIRAFDATSGKQLWDYDLPAAGSAPPSTYEIDGIQYLIVVATGGIFPGFQDHSDAIMAFKLGPTPSHSE